MDDTYEYNKFIQEKLDQIKELFSVKSEQYCTRDALDNFRRGALIEYKNDIYPSMYLVLRGYMLKHITQVFKPLGANKQDECLMDIIVYCLIALYMFKKHKEAEVND